MTVVLGSSSSSASESLKSGPLLHDVLGAAQFRVRDASSFLVNEVLHACRVFVGVRWAMMAIVCRSVYLAETVGSILLVPAEVMESTMARACVWLQISVRFINCYK